MKPEMSSTLRNRSSLTASGDSYELADRIMATTAVTKAAAKEAPDFWRGLRGENQLPRVIAGVRFTDSIAEAATANQRAARSAASVLRIAPSSHGSVS